jgi:hypothetical protein
VGQHKDTEQPEGILHTDSVAAAALLPHGMVHNPRARAARTYFWRRCSTAPSATSSASSQPNRPRGPAGQDSHSEDPSVSQS